MQIVKYQNEIQELKTNNNNLIKQKQTLESKVKEQDHRISALVNENNSLKEHIDNLKFNVDTNLNLNTGTRGKAFSNLEVDPVNRSDPDLLNLDGFNTDLKDK